MFKDNLVKMRKMKQMTQEDIAEKVGVTRQAVAKWEAGETIQNADALRKCSEFPSMIWLISNQRKTWDLVSRPKASTYSG